MVGTSPVDKLYNALDAACTYKVNTAISKDFSARGFDELGGKMKRLYEVLLYMSARGIRYDREGVASLSGKIEDEIDKAQAKLEEVVGFSLNPGSPKQCAEYFYDTLGFTPYKNKGVVTTDDKALARLARRGATGAREVQKLRGLRKLKGTYLDIACDADGRFRCSWNPRVSTGRLSSSETIFGTGSNMQNLDPRVKRYFICDPGNIFLELDKAKAEWVVSAYASGDAKMIAAVESGKDIHALTGAEIAGLTYEDVLEEDEVLGKNTDPVEIDRLRRKYMPHIFERAQGFLPRIFTCRQGGKKSNHALNYIEGYKRFALENEMPENEAKPIVFGYRHTYIGLIDWWRRVDDQLHDDRTLFNCWNIPRTFWGELKHITQNREGDVFANDTLKAAVAHIPQSTIAYLINYGLIDIYEAGYDNPVYDGIDILTQTHDSALFQYPIGNFSAMADATLFIEDRFNPELEYGGRRFSIGTDLKMGLNWGDYHEKENPLGMRKVKMYGDAKSMEKALAGAYHDMLAHV